MTYFPPRGLGKTEGHGVDLLGDRPAANALGADPQRLAGAAGRAHVHLLEVGPESPRRNAGDLRANTSEVFGLPTMGYFDSLSRAFFHTRHTLGPSKTLPNAQVVGNR